jgi:hypothetical protein
MVSNPIRVKQFSLPDDGEPDKAFVWLFWQDLQLADKTPIAFGTVRFRIVGCGESALA